MEIFDGLVALMGSTPYDPVDNPHPYPLIRAGGLFILIVGIGIAIGTVREWLTLPMIFISLLSAFFVMSQVQGALLADMGTLTEFQYNLIIIANIVQGTAIGIWSGIMIPREGASRRYILGILVIVGLHFVFFFPSMGWLMLVVALVCTLWALYTIWQQNISIGLAYRVDGLIKAALGLLMIVWYPV